MKKSPKFFASVGSMLVVSAILLVFGMYAIASDYGESKPYSNSDSVSEVSIPHSADMAAEGDLINAGVGTPDLTPQEELQGKFSKYIHVQDNTVTVFSDEQYAELKAIREEGKRIPLTYDEILFLVNDSINLYFKYDTVVLTKAVVDGITHKGYLNCISEAIETYHGDFSEFVKYDLALQKYEKMLEDIYSIIYYRIYVHDAGFATVYEGELNGDEVAYTEGYMDAGTVQSNKMQLLSLNGGFVSGAENNKLLIEEWDKVIYNRKIFSYNSIVEPIPLSTPLLLTCHVSFEYPTYQILIMNPDGNQKQVFPTNELTELMPTVDATYISGDSSGDWGPYFNIDKKYQRFNMALSNSMSFSLIGNCECQDGILKLYPENVDGSAPKTYSYVFHYEHGMWVYSREASNPPTGAYDIDDGLRFKLYEKNVYAPKSKKPIESIIDYSIVNGIDTAEELEEFYDDGKYVYSFPSIRSQHITVTFTDGTEMPVKEALFKGYIDISDLDKYGIQYYKEPKN